MKSRKQRIIPGLPPGTILTRSILTKNISLSVILYNEYDTIANDITELKQIKEITEPGKITWIQIKEFHSSIVQEIGNYFHLHPLTLEDIMTPNQRPKINDFEDYLYLVMKMPFYNKTTEELSEHQVSLVLGDTYVISFQEKIDDHLNKTTIGPQQYVKDIFLPIQERILNNKGRIRKMKSDYLLYSLIDLMVDHFFIVIEEIEERIDILEDTIIEDDFNKVMHELYKNKQYNITLRKSIIAVREIIRILEKRDMPLIHEETLPFLHDVYEHIIQIIESTETFREIISNIRDVTLSAISNKMNQVMKVLTIFAAIFIPLTFIAGLYGMNFKYMPELEWPWAYPVLLGIMGIVAGIMLIYFKRKKWIGRERQGKKK